MDAIKFDLSKLTIGDLKKLVKSDRDLAATIELMDKAADIDIESLSLDDWLIVTIAWRKALDERADLLNMANMLSQFDNEDEEHPDV